MAKSEIQSITITKTEDLSCDLDQTSFCLTGDTLDRNHSSMVPYGINGFYEPQHCRFEDAVDGKQEYYCHTNMLYMTWKSSANRWDIRTGPGHTGADIQKVHREETPFAKADLSQVTWGGKGAKWPHLNGNFSVVKFTVASDAVDCNLVSVVECLPQESLCVSGAGSAPIGTGPTQRTQEQINTKWDVMHLDDDCDLPGTNGRQMWVNSEMNMYILWDGNNWIMAADDEGSHTYFTGPSTDSPIGNDVFGTLDITGPSIPGGPCAGIVDATTTPVPSDDTEPSATETPPAGPPPATPYVDPDPTPYVDGYDLPTPEGVIDPPTPSPDENGLVPCIGGNSSEAVSGMPFTCDDPLMNNCQSQTAIEMGHCPGSPIETADIIFSSDGKRYFWDSDYAMTPDELGMADVDIPVGLDRNAWIEMGVTFKPNWIPEALANQGQEMTTYNERHGYDDSLTSWEKNGLTFGACADARHGNVNDDVETYGGYGNIGWHKRNWGLMNKEAKGDNVEAYVPYSHEHVDAVNHHEIVMNVGSLDQQSSNELTYFRHKRDTELNDSYDSSSDYDWMKERAGIHVYQGMWDKSYYGDPSVVHHYQAIFNREFYEYVDNTMLNRTGFTNDVLNAFGFVAHNAQFDGDTDEHKNPSKMYKSKDGKYALMCSVLSNGNGLDLGWQFVDTALGAPITVHLSEKDDWRGEDGFDMGMPGPHMGEHEKGYTTGLGRLNLMYQPTGITLKENGVELSVDDDGNLRFYAELKGEPLEENLPDGQSKEDSVWEGWSMTMLFGPEDIGNKLHVTAQWLKSNTGDNYGGVIGEDGAAVILIYNEASSSMVAFGDPVKAGLRDGPDGPWIDSRFDDSQGGEYSDATFVPFGQTSEGYAYSSSGALYPILYLSRGLVDSTSSSATTSVQSSIQSEANQPVAPVSAASNVDAKVTATTTTDPHVKTFFGEKYDM